jgi:hypothetical protein
LIGKSTNQGWLPMERTDIGLKYGPNCESLSFLVQSNQGVRSKQDGQNDGWWRHLFFPFLLVVASDGM